MAFSLVYSAEHYVVDILAGWAVTAVVCTAAALLRRRRRRQPAGPPAADTLEARTAPSL